MCRRMGGREGDWGCGEGLLHLLKVKTCGKADWEAFHKSLIETQTSLREPKDTDLRSSLLVFLPLLQVWDLGAHRLILDGCLRETCGAACISTVCS